MAAASVAAPAKEDSEDNDSPPPEVAPSAALLVELEELKMLAETRLKDQDELRDQNLKLQQALSELKDQSIPKEAEAKHLERQLRIVQQELKSKHQQVEKLQHDLDRVINAREVDRSNFAESENKHLSAYQAKGAAMQEKMDKMSAEMAQMEKAKEALSQKIVDQHPESDKALLNADFAVC